MKNTSSSPGATTRPNVSRSPRLRPARVSERSTLAQVRLSVRAVIVSAAAGLCAASPTSANSYYSTTTLTISNLLVESNNDNLYPAYVGTVEVYFTQAITWSSMTSCSTAAVFIRSGDSPLITAAEVAYTTGQPVKLYVDDSQQLAGVRYLRAMQH
jgi:hypothetical protein